VPWANPHEGKHRASPSRPAAISATSKTEGEELAAQFDETPALASINTENAFRTLVKETRKQAGGGDRTSKRDLDMG
jgi:hypothetical protein